MSSTSKYLSLWIITGWIERFSCPTNESIVFVWSLRNPLIQTLSTINEEGAIFGKSFNSANEMSSLSKNVHNVLVARKQSASYLRCVNLFSRVYFVKLSLQTLIICTNRFLFNVWNSYLSKKERMMKIGLV